MRRPRRMAARAARSCAADQPASPSAGSPSGSGTSRSDTGACGPCRIKGGSGSPAMNACALASTPAGNLTSASSRDTVTTRAPSARTASATPALASASRQSSSDASTYSGRGQRACRARIALTAVLPVVSSSSTRTSGRACAQRGVVGHDERLVNGVAVFLAEAHDVRAFWSGPPGGMPARRGTAVRGAHRGDAVTQPGRRLGEADHQRRLPGAAARTSAPRLWAAASTSLTGTGMCLPSRRDTSS